MPPKTSTKSRAPGSRAESPSSWKFDLYAMGLPFLSDAYLPEGETEPQFVALYQTIKEYQAKSDFTGQCVLPLTGSTGRLKSNSFQDPMEDLPWNIVLTDLSRLTGPVFSSKESAKFLTPPQEGTLGISGRMALVQGHCGVQSAKGVFRMQHAWTGSTGEQIFEGYMSFNVRHSALYQRKGHGEGSKFGFPFWGVRARRDTEGKEIGLDAPEHAEVCEC